MIMMMMRVHEYYIIIIRKKCDLLLSLSRRPVESCTSILLALYLSVVRRQRRYGDAARARRVAGENLGLGVIKGTKDGHDAEELIAPMVT